MIWEPRSPILVDTPLGRGYALVIEMDATDNYWTVVLQDSRGFVTFTQDQIRMARSYTLGVGMGDDEMRGILSGG